MSKTPNETEPQITTTEFEQITKMVSAEFKIEVALLDQNNPTYYLKQPQETKQTFLRLLKKLEPINMIATLRKHERVKNLIVLKIIPKPLVKQSNTLINWILLFATIATTFVTGYLISVDTAKLAERPVLDPLIGGATFTAAIMLVLGSHEMGHKLLANKRGVEATPPYFVPGPPPLFGAFGLGTFGAVILQKSLPSNRDSLFDISSSGPVIGFVAASIVTALGLTLSIPVLYTKEITLPPPTPLFMLIHGLLHFEYMPLFPGSKIALLHPIALAGWIGMLITMLNLLPVAMLDGGHIARSMISEGIRNVVTLLVVVLLTVKGFWMMIVLVLYLSTYEHPGPLDDVSELSKGRKLFTIALIAIFVLSFPL